MITKLLNFRMKRIEWRRQRAKLRHESLASITLYVSSSGWSGSGRRNFKVRLVAAAASRSQADGEFMVLIFGDLFTSTGD